MNLKDDSEGISKTILDWLTRVGGIVTALGGIAAALAAIFALFFPNLGDDAQRIAFGVAGLLAMASIAVYFYQRRRAARLKIAESLEPLSASAALRGLLPFEEGDQLPGRARDVQELYTLVASSAFRFGVLWGESGCGKTSLLRAGLTPKLRNEKFLPLYIGKPTKEPQKAIRSALTKEIPDLEKRGEKNLNSLLKVAAPKGKKIVILFDQFEEFFLTNRTPSSRAAFIKWLGEVVNDENLPVAFLIGIRADFFAQLQNFAPQIPEPTSTHSTYELQNFDTEQAKQIFSAAAKADGIPFEPALIQAVVKELETEEFIRPAELQVVGTRLKRKNIFTLNRYDALGGARGVLSSYISDEIKQSPNQQAARLVLRLMCADVVETKSQTDLSLDDILRGVSGVEQPSGEKAAGHPDEIQAILKQFVNARVLIHTDENKYNLVHDYLAPYVRTATEGTETNTERANRMLKRYVAEYKEDRKTRIPFGRLRWIQKYATAETKGGEKAGELARKSKRTFYLKVILALPFVFTMLVVSSIFWLGPPYTSITTTVEVFGFVSQIKPEAITPEMLQTLINISIDPQADRNVLHRAQDLLSSLPKAKIKAVSPEILHVLINFVVDPKTDSRLRYRAVSTLTALTQANPEAVTSNAITPDLLQRLIYIIGDPQSSSSLRDNAESVYELLSEANPEVVLTDAVTHDMLQTHINIITDLRTNENLRIESATRLRLLSRARPDLITPKMLQTLINLIPNTKEKELSFRVSLRSALTSLAQTQQNAVTPDMLQSLVTVFANPPAQEYVRKDTAFLLSSLAQANPEVVTPEMLQTLINIIADQQADDAWRVEAAGVLNSFAKANPEAVTSDIFGQLLEISLYSKEIKNTENSTK